MGPGHGDGDGAVEFDDGGGCGLGESGVEGGDAEPVGGFGGGGAGVAGGDGGLEGVGAGGLLSARLVRGRRDRGG